MHWFSKIRFLPGIRGKLIALISIVGTSSTITLSLLVNFQLRSIIFEQTLQVCRDLSVNISQVAREELLLNNIYVNTRDVMQNMQKRSVRGLVNSYIINRDGSIVAHSNPSLEGKQLDLQTVRDYQTYRSIKQEEVSGNIRIIVPITIEYESKIYFLGASIFEFDRNAILIPITRIQNRILLLSVIIIFISLLAAIVFAGRLSNPIEELAEAARKIGQGNLGHQVNISQKDEIGQLALHFNRMSRQLSVHQKRMLVQATMHRELEIARDIQLSLLPAGQNLGPYEFRGYMQTADQVGGDYYDCIEIKHGRQTFWWFVIGDVSGHGLPAGLTMLMAQTAVQTALRVQTKLEPDTFFVLVNDILYENIQRLESQRYMTAAFYRADRQGQIQYAGLHLDALVYRSKTKKIQVYPTQGMWLAVESSIVNETKVNKFKLNFGDLLFLFTDGIVETMDSNRAMFGQDRLEKFLEKNGSLSLQEIEQKLLASLTKFSNGKAYADDISFAMIRKIK